MLNIIAARCRNRGIGLAGTLPWRFKKDLQYFKDLTIGDGNNAVVVGNSTYKRLPCLPKRDTLVLTNNTDTKTYIDNVYYFNSIPSLHEFCEKKQYMDVWVAGGENVYKQFLADPKVNSIYLTDIDIDVPCDTYFPHIPPIFTLASISRETERGIDLDFQIYKRPLRSKPLYHEFKGSIVSPRSSSIPSTFMPTGLNI